MSIGKRIAHTEQEVHTYIDEVLDGTIPACRFTKLALQRHLDDLEKGPDRGLYFDTTEAFKVVSFFPTLRLWEGDAAGQPFELLPHWKCIMWVLMGWKRENGLRRFRKAYIETARKSAKSTNIGGLIDYLFIMGNEGGAQLYSAANKKDQAMYIYNAAKNCLQNSSWASQVNFLQYKMMREDNLSFVTALAADRDTMDGPNPYFVGLDEYHQAKNSGVHDSLLSGMTRAEPLMAITTTAGFDQYLPCYKMREYVVDILKGKAKNDSFFGTIFTLDVKADWPDLVGLAEDKAGKKEDDFRDPDVWLKANPGIPWNVPRKDTIEEFVQTAVDMPSQLNKILTKNFNVWTTQAIRWIGMDLWDSNAEKVEWESFRAKQVFGGTDLSGISDLTAHVWIRSSEDEGVYVKAYFWCTRAWLDDPTNKYAESFLQWAKDGHIFIQEGNAIDYEAIRQYIDKEARRLKLNIHSSNVDRGFDGHEFAVRFDELLGGTDKHPKVALATAMQLTTSIDKAERLLLDEKLHHDGNPILRFCVDNAAIKTNFDERRRVDKAGSHGKIDGVIALLLAIDRWMRVPDSVFGQEGYEMPTI